MKGRFEEQGKTTIYVKRTSSTVKFDKKRENIDF